MKHLPDNLAFKCTWNDAGFKGICGNETYEHNLSMNRAWCQKAECRTFTSRPTDENHPCYESILLSEWRFGAGWDHRIEKRPRKIKKARIGKIALLTTLLPKKSEKNRKIIGFFKIGKIKEGKETETVIYGDPNRSLAIEPSLDVKFWKYYKNLGNPERIAWGTGLFRYLSDAQVFQFLNDLKRMYSDRGLDSGDVRKIDQIIEGIDRLVPPLKEKNRDEHDVKVCNHCERDNLLQAKFCNQCGKTFNLRCPNCETTNPPEGRFCYECGSEIAPIGPNPNAAHIAEQLIVFGRRHLEKVKKERGWLFTPDMEANRLIQNNPLAYLFAVILDQGIGAEKAWKAPYELMQRMGHLDPFRISNMKMEKLEEHFKTPSKLHRFWPTMARRIRNASGLVIDKYQGSAENIWSDEPNAKTLFDRLCEFDGIGQKKASMAVNILFRDLGVKIRDKSGIDVSYDIMVRRVFLRTGIAKSDSLKEIVEAARDLNPSYPGELDYPAWIIGRTWCLPKRPKCSECAVSSACSKINVR